MDSLWQALTGAPWWVYVLFIYLMSIGIKSLKPRTIPFQRVVLFPLIFVTWSAYDLYTKVKLGHPTLIPWWLICLTFGAILGYIEVYKWHFEVDKKKQTITIPPNYSTIVLILLIFSINFFFGYYYATQTIVSYGMYFANIVIGSLVTGIFLGRGIVFFLNYTKS